jgi:hypothetical protein
LHDRIATIPHGVNVPTELDREGNAGAGRPGLLVMGWIAEARDVVTRLLPMHLDDGAPVKVTVIDPPDDASIPPGARVVRIPNRAEWGSLCRTHHVLLTFDWHGDRRRQVIEAMGHGLVPIVWGDDPSDAPFRDGASGHALRGDPEALITVLAHLRRDGHWHAAAERARLEVVGRHYSIDQMVDTFIDRLVWVRECQRRRPSRPRVSPPPEMVGEHRIFGAPLTVVTEWGPFPDDESVRELGRPWPLPDPTEPT